MRPWVGRRHSQRRALAPPLRGDDDLVDALAEDRIAYVPFFPLGGFTPLQSAALSKVAKRHDTTTISIALAWLLQRSPNMLLIPGTSSEAHLRENVGGAAIELGHEDLMALDTVGRRPPVPH